MKRFPTLILRCAVPVAGVIALLIDSGITWWVVRVCSANPDHTAILIVLLAGLYSATIPFMIALFQAMKLLSYIDTSRAFSDLSVRALTVITRCIGTIFVIYTVSSLPFFYYWAQFEDAPGLMLIGLAMCGVVFVIAVFASVLKRLFQEALAVKSENDLTI